MRLVKCLMVLTLVFAVSAIAYAETQSVKVSGDLTMRALARNNFDLSSGDYDGNPAASTDPTSDWDTHLINTAEVQIDADLTDNVAGVIRLINQRAWGNTEYNSQNDNELATAVPATAGEGLENQFDVEIDLAYIELKEFLYSPLTLRIGRQDLSFGRELIIGENYQDPATALFAPEYTAVTSYDAVRATLDYDPWTIDGIFAKIAENARRNSDDVNLWGVNVGYVFDEYNAEMEGYWFYDNDRRSGQTNVGSRKYIDDVHTVGLRGSFDPIEDWTVALEGAYQFGENVIGTSTVQVNDRDRSAWMVDAMAECRYFQDDYAWRPVLSIEYLFLSGEKESLDQTAAAPGTGEWEGWNPMYRGKRYTAIRDYQNIYYTTQSASTAANTNQHMVIVEGIVEPTDSLTCSAKYAHFWLAEKASAANTRKNIGDEVDFEMTWDYTEDVQFGLLTAWFVPGNHFPDNQDAVATDIVGTVSLSF